MIAQKSLGNNDMNEITAEDAKAGAAKKWMMGSTEAP